ncbi:cyclase family protein [Nocardioides humi]|uniref:cyclase family protein n=1 Tax=Nocardioides humi TaxID=449461 RepID=UPI0031CE623F
MRAYAHTLADRQMQEATSGRGAIAYLTAETRRQALAEVREGVTYSLAQPISAVPGPDQIFGPPLHLDLEPPFAEQAGEGGRYDYLGLAVHGFDLTHVDALSHTSYQGRFFGGRSVAEARKTLDVRMAADGLVARAVLLDVPDARGLEWIDHGTPVLPAEIEEILRRQKVTPRPGDAYLLYTGRTRRLAEAGGRAIDSQPGWHVGCLPWLRDGQASVVGCDVVCEYMPSGYAFRIPFHTFGISQLGLWILDTLDLDRAVRHCRRTRRYEFALIVAPLPLVGGTGSPVNPLAIF